MAAFPSISIIGIGRIGMQLGAALHKAGWPITAVHGLHKTDSARAALALGAKSMANAAEAVAAGDILICTVPDDKALALVYSTEAEGVLAAAKGKLFINTSTASPQAHQEAARKITEAGGQALECCIAHARDGALYFLCAGEKGAYERAKPLLQAVSPHHRYLGPAGEAAKFKVLATLVMNLNTAVLAEAMGLAHALKIDLGLLQEIFSETEANSQVLATDGPAMAKGDHACRFSAAHAAKDCAIALALAQGANLSLPVTQAGHDQYARMVAKGLGELDKSGIAQLTFLDRMRPAPPNV